MLEHLSFVEATARRCARFLPKSVALDDMIQAGCVGLIKAAHRFDPSRPTSFWCFASRAVQGAIINAFNRHNYDFELHWPLQRNMADPAPPADEVIYRRQMCRHLWRGINSLSDEERQAVVAHLLEERPYREHPGGISQAYRRTQSGLRKLRRHLLNISSRHATR